MSDRDVVFRGPKVAERIFSNKIFLRDLRLRLKARQPNNEVFHRLLDDLDDRTLVEQYLRHCPVYKASVRSSDRRSGVKRVFVVYK